MTANTLSPSLVGVFAGIVIALAGVGSYLQASLGGPGSTAFVVRLLLVFLAVVGALLLGLAVRVQSSDTGPASRARPAYPEHDP
jgi:putative copper export protein